MKISIFECPKGQVIRDNETICFLKKQKNKVFRISRWVDHPVRPSNTFFFTILLCKTLI
jgi:hypothetical protein